MYSTTVYLYQQIQKVLLVDTSGAYFTARWNPVYSKTLTINKGVDNVILFEFINQDQTPVNISGSEFVFKLLNQEGDQVLFSKQLELLSPTIGRAKLVMEDSDSIGLDAQPASYSITVSQPLGSYTQAVYVDAYSQARGQVNIVDSVDPTFVPSKEVTIPTVYGPDIYPAPNVNSGRPAWALPQTAPQPYTPPRQYSSQVDNPTGDFHTFALKMDHFTGNVVVQAASNYQGPWADVSDSLAYYSESKTKFINVAGYYNLLRLAINTYGGEINGIQATATAVCSGGQVTSINLTNNGSGYIAAPLVTITGVGAGATAQAFITNGSVTSIVVTNPGSGYVPTPPASQAANVNITTGAITQILYR
jgi:hypothetical protein